MDELKLLKLAELRSKIGAIPAKLLVTFLISGGLYWQFSFEKFMEDPGTNIFAFVVTYGIISYFWLCVKMTRNWLVGFGVAIILILVWVGSMDKMSEVFQVLIGGAICFGGPVIDVLAVIRYFVIRKQVFGIPGNAVEDESGADWGQWQENRSQEGQQAGQAQESAPVFFADCKGQAGIKRRYRDLCRVYHPDNGNGSPEVFNRITEEYERLMAQYGQENA